MWLTFLQNFFWGVFLFVIGFVSAIGAIVFYIDYYLNLGEKKSAEDYAKTVKESIKEREELNEQRKQREVSKANEKVSQ